MTKFVEVTVRQAAEGQPGFIEDDEFYVKISPEQITLFNSGLDNKGEEVTFVRLSCGATLCVVCQYDKFEKLLAKAK